MRIKISWGEGDGNVLTSMRRKKIFNIFLYAYTHKNYTNTEHWHDFGMVFQKSHPKWWVLIKIVPFHHIQNIAKISHRLKNVYNS